MYLKFLHHFPNLPHPLRSVYDPSKPTLAILYREVSHMLLQNISQNQPSGSGEEVV